MLSKTCFDDCGIVFCLKFQIAAKQAFSMMLSPLCITFGTAVISLRPSPQLFQSYFSSLMPNSSNFTLSYLKKLSTESIQLIFSLALASWVVLDLQKYKKKEKKINKNFILFKYCFLGNFLVSFLLYCICFPLFFVLLFVMLVFKLGHKCRQTHRQTVKCRAFPVTD